MMPTEIMKKPGPKDHRLLIASSETDADLFYATGFLAPDPFVFLEIRGKRYLLVNDLELDRAKRTARGCRIVPLSALAQTLKARTGKAPSLTEILVHFARRHGASAFSVPASFPIRYADLLRRQGLRLFYREDPFFESRRIKTAREIRAITRTLRKIERAAHFAVSVLKRSVARRGKLFLRGKVLTSEKLRRMIESRLLELGCLATRTIVACGDQAVDPHEAGRGPLRPGRPIVIDIFPRDLESRYFGDFTRTFVKGKAPEKLKAVYRAVLEAQKTALKKIRHGARADQVHAVVEDFFSSQGFRTGKIRGRMQGFFHGTGHGIGLELHEPPSVGKRPIRLEAGNVITVEPGLYYRGTGGVRLEDVALVTKTGCRLLTRFPKILEL
ncbi:MAG: M24 family metallopeptidase [Candidatus Omnitrophota bacterium]